MRLQVGDLLVEVERIAEVVRLDEEIYPKLAADVIEVVGTCLVSIAASLATIADKTKDSPAGQIQALPSSLDLR